MNDDDLWLDAALDDELDAAASLALQRRLDADPALRARWQARCALRDALRAHAGRHAAPAGLRERVADALGLADDVAVARRFVFIPAEITARVGEAVVLEFSAPEVVMGFYAPALGLRALIVPGAVSAVPFTAGQVGRFDFLCDVFCGDGHEGMSGRLVVQP